MGEVISFELQQARIVSERWETSMWDTIEQIESLLSDSYHEKNAWSIRMLMGGRWMFIRAFDQDEAASDEHRLIGYSTYSNLGLIKLDFLYQFTDDRYLECGDLSRLPFVEYEVAEYVPSPSDVNDDPSVVVGAFTHSTALVCQAIDQWKETTVDYCATHNLFIEPIIIAYGAFSQIPEHIVVEFDTSNWEGAAGTIALRIAGEYDEYVLTVRVKHDIWQRNCELAEKYTKPVEDS